jgi:hypothetical protein
MVLCIATSQILKKNQQALIADKGFALALQKLPST